MVNGNGNGTVFKWIAGALLSVILLGAGGVIGDWLAAGTHQILDERLDRVEQQTAVENTRLDHIESDIAEIKDSILRMERQRNVER